jgi:flagellar basal-body rod modification protein FlgD
MSAVSSATGGLSSTLAADSAANSAAASPSSSSSSSSTSSLGSLSESDFLQLLVAQMKYQDPTSPTSGTDFMAELAQFSTVEGIDQLDTDFTTQSLTQSAGLIGQTVGYTDANNQAASGVVNSVSMTNGQVQVSVNNTEVNLSQLTSIGAE